MIFFHFDIFIHFFKYEIIETHARALLTIITLGIATVNSICKIESCKKYNIANWHC